jgi:hypothetical protein
MVAHDPPTKKIGKWLTCQSTNPLQIRNNNDSINFLYYSWNLDKNTQEIPRNKDGKRENQRRKHMFPFSMSKSANPITQYLPI